MSTPPPGPPGPLPPGEFPREQPVPSPFGHRPPPPPQPFGGVPPYGQQQQFGQQSYGYGPTSVGARNNGFAIASMVLGIVGIPFFCLFAIPSILAIIFGGIALAQFNKDAASYTGKGMAIAGLILGVLGVAILVLVIAIADSGTGVSRGPIG